MANEGYLFTKGMPKPKHRYNSSREWLKDKLRERPEAAVMDRAKAMTREEKARGAIDRTTKEIMADQHQAGEAMPSEEKARQHATEIAQRVERQKDIDGRVK